MGGQGGTGGDVQGDWSLRRSSGACGGSIKRGIFNNEPLWNLRRSCALYNTRVSTRPVECSPSCPTLLEFYRALFSCFTQRCSPVGGELSVSLLVQSFTEHCSPVTAELTVSLLQQSCSHYFYRAVFRSYCRAVSRLFAVSFLDFPGWRAFWTSSFKLCRACCQI